ncbi:MAG: DUF4097 family beta strand repeat protein [Corynebacteriales bacterium]|nr:DUF4097 family beta strand repeat protein [Mycobacteriales bacterium]
MPTFDTSEPIFLTLEFDVGNVRVNASKRADTIVDVQPTNAAEDLDVRCAEQTKVSFSNGKLLVKGPKKRSPFGRHGSIEVNIELPIGSDIQGSGSAVDFSCTGRLGDCKFKTSVGHIQVEEAGTVQLKSDHGNIDVERASGHAEIYGMGRIHIRSVSGVATIKNGNGDTTIGEAAGPVRANAANGRINVDIARSDVDAKSANGSIRIGDITRGQIVLQAAAGDLEVGIRESTAAWLDLKTHLGTVSNSLARTDGPGASKETAEVRARTAIGDIVIRRP